MFNILYDRLEMLVVLYNLDFILSIKLVFKEIYMNLCFIEFNDFC